MSASGRAVTQQIFPPSLQTNFQTSQPMPVHIALLIASAKTQGDGDAYLSTGP